MEKSRLIDWVQISTMIAVVVGLVLVVIELRQSHTLAQQQATAATFSDLISVQQTYLGEDFMTTFAKACADPTDLTDSELLQMRAYRNIQLIVAGRAKINQETAGFDYEWERAAQGPMLRWLYTPVGRAQVQTLADADPELQKIAEQLLANEANTPVPSCAEELALTREALLQEPE